MIRRVYSIFAIVILILIISSCFVQEQFVIQQKQNDELGFQNSELKKHNSILQNQIIELQNQTQKIQLRISELEIQKMNQQNQTLVLQEQNSQLENKIDQLLEELLVSQFNNTLTEYNKYIQPLIFDNGTLIETHDYSNPNITTTSSVSQYAYTLLNYYKETNDSSDIKKIETWLNSYMTNPFFQEDFGYSRIHYLPQYVNNANGIEGDHTAKLTMYAALTAIDLYELTGNETYKQFADEVAYESRNLFPIVDNATDIAYSWDYCGMSDLTAYIGVNRMCSIAWFYSRYASINASFASYVPLILNWAMRAQLANGGLAYTIGATTESSAYTAYQIYFALKAYENVPFVFTEDLKNKIQNSINRILQYSPHDDYLKNVVYSACLVEAVKSGFVSSPSASYLNTTKNFLSQGLNILVFNSDGVYSDKNYGIRWSMYFLSSLFANYPLIGVWD